MGQDPVDPARLTAPSRETSTPTTNRAPTERLASLGSRYGAVGVPDRIGRYAIKSVLGAGGMGVVYLATQESPERDVALKVMKDGMCSPRLRKRFESEAHALARLQHPHIAQIFEAGTHYAGGPEDEPLEVPYYAMEFVRDAQSLLRFTRERGLSPEARIRLFVKIARALHHAHQRGLVHRDIKPGNILVAPNGEPKIIDFGVSRDLFENPAATANTQPGQLVGTLQYMSPEQVATGVTTIDHRSDVYSLGVVLYELLRGKLPYDLSDVGMLKVPQVIRETAPIAPRGEDAAFPADLQTILLTALHKDRSQRYQTADDLADELDRYLSNQPIRASGDSVWYILSTRARAAIADHAALVLALWALAAALIGAYAATPLLFPDWSALMLQRAALAIRGEAPPPQSFEHVRIVMLTETTDIAGLAARERLSGIDPAEPVTRRPLDARLLERLARAGPRAIAWDIVYLGETDSDALLRRAAELGFASTGVVMASNMWSHGVDNHSDVSHVLTPTVRVGCAWLGDDEHANLFVQLASGSALAPARSLAVEAFAVARDANMPAAATIDAGGGSLVLRMAPTGDGRATMPPVLIPAFIQTEAEADPSIGVRAGDLVALRQITIPSDEALNRATFDYQRVMEADESTLRAWFAGRTVAVGSIRPDALGRIDRHPYADGRSVPGVAAQAAALESLLQSFDVRSPSAAQEGLLALVVASAALAVGWRFRSTLARSVGLLALVVVAWGVCITLAATAQLLPNPLAILVTMLLATAAAPIVRRSHPARLT